MNVAYLLSGGSPVVKKYKVGASVTTNGIPLLDTSTATAGIRVATTTSGANCIGLGLDQATYTTTQSTTMIEGVISVVINPDLVSRARMSGTTASGGALVALTNTSASTNGTVYTITTGDPVPNSPTMLDGTIYALVGNNSALTRVITSVAATTATVVVPFPRTIAVGDTAIMVPWAPVCFPAGAVATAILTTALDEVRQNGDASSDFELDVVDMEFDTGNPTTNSYLHILFRDHVFKDNS